MDRRSFVKKAGAAGLGAAALGVTGAASASAEGRAEVTDPSGPVPAEPLVAYVRDVERGEVTVVSGHARDDLPGSRAGQAPGQGRGRGRRRAWSRCRPIAKHPRSARTRSPTTPTPTRSSARTSPTPSRSSPTTSRSRARPAARTSSSSATTSSTRSTSTTTATPSPTSSTTSGSTSKLRNPNTFLYNTGPIGSLNDPNWNRRQFYSVTAPQRPRTGARSARAWPRRPATSARARRPTTRRWRRRRCTTCRRGETVFAGQRNDGFFVDLGSIFDLGDLRPFQNLHLIPSAGDARASTRSATLNVHTIAIQVPITHLTRDGSRPTDPSRAKAVLGIWGAASRRRVKVTRRRQRREGRVRRLGAGVAARQPAVQRGDRPARQEGPLERDRTRPATGRSPSTSSTRSSPSSCRCSIRACSRTWPASQAERADLVAILLTGLPSGIVPGSRTSPGRRWPTCCA